MDREKSIALLNETRNDFAEHMKERGKIRTFMCSDCGHTFKDKRPVHEGAYWCRANDNTCFGFARELKIELLKEDPLKEQRDLLAYLNREMRLLFGGK